MVINDNVSLEDVAEENGETNCLTEVDVSEKTIKFKISTDCNVGGGRKSYPGSRKGSRERVQCLNNSELTRIIQKGKLRKGALSFDQHCSFASKKLSFDSPEFLDEYAITLMKKFNNFPGEVREDVDDEADECVSENTRGFNKRNSQQHAFVTKDEKDLDGFEDGETSPARYKSIVNNGNLDETPEGVKLLQKTQNLDDAGIGIATNDLKILNNGDYSEPKISRSLLQRLKQFTDRFASSDKDPKRQFKLSFAKNNNVAGGTLPSANRKKLENVCCKSLERVDDRRASTLPKTKKTSLKKGWKLLLPKRGKPSGRLDGWVSDVNVNKLECGLLDNDNDNQSLPSTSKSQSNCTLNVSPKRSAKSEPRAEEAPSAHHVSPIKCQPRSEYSERRLLNFKTAGGGGHRIELKKGARRDVLVKSPDLI